MMQHMERTIDEADAKLLLQHVHECASCHEYYIAFDTVMEYAASPQVEIHSAPANFTAAVMAKISPAAETAELRKRGYVTQCILWGVGLIFLGVAVFFFFNPDSFAALVGALPALATVVDAVAGFGVYLRNFAERFLQDPYVIDSSYGVAALMFALLLGIFLVVLQKGEENAA